MSIIPLPLKQLFQDYSRPLLTLFSYAFILSLIPSFRYLLSLDELHCTALQTNGFWLLGIKTVVASLAYSFLMMLIPIAGLRHQVRRKILYTFTYTLVSFFFVAESFLFDTYGCLYTTDVATSIFATNLQEVQEFGDSIFSWVLLLPSILIPSLVFFFSSSVIFTLINKIRGGYLLFLIILPLSLLSITYQVYGHVNRMRVKWVFYEASNPLERFVLSNAIVWQENAQMKDVVRQLESKSTLLHLDGAIAEPHNVVLVLGESLSRGFMHCYGYPVPNTPRIDSLSDLGELILYTDVIAPAPNTISSLSKVLTFQLNSSDKEWFHYLSLPQTMAKAGYTTSWISNQERGNSANTVYLISQMAQQSHFVGSISSLYWDPKTKSYDEVLLPLLRSVEIEQSNRDEEMSTNRKLFQVVHLMGNHTNYSARFPEQYARFKPEDLPRSYSKDKGHSGRSYSQIATDYINSIYYNDYVVSEIFKYHQDKNSLVIYFSDHGQRLFDDPRAPEKFGHGVTEGALSVPFIVYMSPRFRRQYPELYEQVKRAKDNRVMLDLFSHSLCSLLGIVTEYHDASLDFFGSDYNNKRPRQVFGLGRQVIY